MAGANVVRMASGGNPPKFYFHVQPVGSYGRILVEALSGPGGLSITVKAQDAALAPAFEGLFAAAAVGFS